MNGLGFRAAQRNFCLLLLISTCIGLIPIILVFFLLKNKIVFNIVSSNVNKKQRQSNNRRKFAMVTRWDPRAPNVKQAMAMMEVTLLDQVVWDYSNEKHLHLEKD